MSDYKVPIKVWLDGDVYRPLMTLAKTRGLDEVGPLLEQLARKAITPAAPAKRSWRRVTPEVQGELDRLHALGYGRRAIAERLGISLGSVDNHRPKEQAE